MRDFECHITVNNGLWANEELEYWGNAYGWKTSFIEGDPDLGHGKRFFFTRHYDEFEKAREGTNQMATALQGAGELRKKIEEVLMDTRAGTWK